MTPRIRSRRRREWLVAAGLLAGACAVFVATRDKAAALPAAVETATSRIPERFAHAPGVTLSYSFEWSSSTAMQIVGGQSTSSAVTLAGVIDLVGAGARGERTLVLARIRSLRETSVVAMGHDLVPDEAAANDLFVGRTAAIEYDARGIIAQIHVPKDAPPLFRHLMHELLARTQVTLPTGAEQTWVASEAGDNGPIAYRYGRGVDGVLRKEASEPTVSARGEVRFDANGAVASQEQEAHFATGKHGELDGVVALSRFTRTLGATRVDAPPAIDLATYEAHAPGARAAEVDRKGQLEQLAQQTSLADVVTMVAAYAQGQRPAKGAVTRGMAFLLLHPEACQSLLALFEKDALGTRGREMIMDLLSSAGDDAAQAAMRAALASPAALADRDAFGRLLQRFSMLDDPRPESIALVQEIFKRSKAAHEEQIHYASIYTLGALAGHAHEHKKDLLAQPILDQLVRGLDAKPPLDEETAFLAALGNTGMVGALDPLKRRAASDEARVRAQVAISLRRFDEAEIRAILVEMLCDRDARTALHALETLDKLSVSAAEMERVATLVEDAKTNVQADAQLVPFAASRAFAKDAARRMLRVIEARATENPELAIRARGAMAKLAE